MSYYTNEELKDFWYYAKDYIKDLSDLDKSDGEGLEKVKDLIKVIQSMYFNAMVFESYINGHSAHDYILNKDLNMLPLHINDEGLLSKVIIKWRLERNK